MNGPVSINIATAISDAGAPPDQPRAIGAVTLSCKSTPRGTALADLRQSGAMKALFPRPNSSALQAVVINTAGGITGGDDFTLTARAGEHSSLSLTTQAAERAYRAQPGQTGKIRNRLFVGRDARLDWVPQETILYDGSALNRSLCVEMEDQARLLLVEPLIFGRSAMGEVLGNAFFKDRIEIRRQGTPLFLDAMTLRGDIAAHLASPHTAAGAGAMASLVYVSPDAAAQLGPVRDMLPDTAGASLIRDDLLALRILAADGYGLRQSLVPILRHLTNQALPRSWMT
ncbi:urease accessory protein [Roseovarius lutimaris]|uniref:Urease accessory protein UreD n=1 Tax=Roseovarius lutimaris TaxID=1005928 RepID=A0A1I4Z0A0_9RHOB|nr:urease accessory protein UreD [Roseovarius lutimaris]SFN43473.1 urease accessory protein [Roseovarius lutimaris]